MNGVTFPIFFLSDEEQSLYDKGMLKDEETAGKEIKEITFYNIDYSRVYKEGLSIVSVSGKEFIVNEDIESVNMRIRMARLFLNN